MTEEKNLFDDIKSQISQKAAELDETVGEIFDEEEAEEISRPLSYYKELRKNPALAEELAGARKAQEQAFTDGKNTENSEDDDDEPSRPLSWYKEQKAAGEKAAKESALPVQEIISPVQKAAEEDDDDEPSRPLSWYKEQKAAAEKSLQEASAPPAEEPAFEAVDEKQPEQKIVPPAKKQPIFPVKGKPFGVQGIAETAVLAAIATILGFFSYAVPVLSMVAPLFFPLPMAILTMRRGLASGICGTLVTGLLLALIMNPINSLLMIVQSGLVGIFFGYCLHKQKKPFVALIGGTVIAALGYGAALVLSTFFSGISFAEILAGMDEMLAEYSLLLQNMGFFDMLIAQGMDPEIYMQELNNQLKMLLPGVMIISSMLLTFASYWLLGKILAALGYERENLPPFTEWRLSWHFVWGIIIGGFLMFFGYTKESQILYNIGTNILYVFAPLLLITAAAVITAIKRARGWSGMMTVMIWLFILMMLPVSLYALVLVGVFDPLVDFRAKFATVSNKES